MGAAGAAGVLGRDSGLADVWGLAGAGRPDGQGDPSLPDGGTEEVERMGPHRAAAARQLSDAGLYPQHLPES